MKRVLFNIVIPLSVMVLWMITCYPVCNKAEGFDYFLYWIMVGCPYGIRKMCMFLIPRNFGIAGSMGVLALNCIVGGLIGGIFDFPHFQKVEHSQSPILKYSNRFICCDLTFVGIKALIPVWLMDKTRSIA